MVLVKFKVDFHHDILFSTLESVETKNAHTTLSKTTTTTTLAGQTAFTLCFQIQKSIEP